MSLYLTNLLQTSLALLTFMTLYLVYRYFIKVYLDMRYYTKQGAIPIFHKRLVGFFRNYKDAVEKGDFYHMYKEIAKKHPEARCLVENFGDSVTLIPIDVNMVKEYLTRHEDYQRARDLFGLNVDLSDGNIVLEEGNAWKKQRKHMSSAFHYEHIKNTIPMIVEVAKEKFNDWAKNGDLEHFDVKRQLGMITGEISGRFFFGRRFSKENLWGVPFPTATQNIIESVGLENFKLANAALGPNFARMGILPRHRTLNRQIKEYRNKCGELIEEVDKTGVREDNFLGSLLEKRKGPIEKDDDYLTNEKIIGSFIGLFLASTDTTALVLNSVLYNLSQHPEVLKKVKEEIDREVTDFNCLMADTVGKLLYTAAVIKETLRMGSAVGGFFPRVAVKDDDLCGINVKRGTLIFSYLQVPHCSDKYFSDPCEFRPERWLKEDEGLKADDQAFLSFCVGPRSCVGQQFGMMQMKVILSTLLKSFDMEFPSDYQMKLVQGNFLAPMSPFVIKMKPKNEDVVA